MKNTMAESGGEKNDSPRRWFYSAVLVFIVTAGILLVVVPPIRARLLDRVHILMAAMAGDVMLEITPMGENGIPYPEEFMRPRSGTIVTRPSPEPFQKRLSGVQSTDPAITPPVLLGAVGSGISAEAGEDDDNTIRFLQGEIEREAYEKTLAANEKLASAVQGGDSGLSFTTWGAAQRDGSVYWVRVIFRNVSGADAEYIWQTDISSGKTDPLNFNARNF